MPSPLLCQSGVDNAAGHGSATSESLLSELGFLDRDQRLPDELNKLECYLRVYQGLHDPDTAGSQHIADRDSDSDWDVVSPDVVMLPPGAANNCPLHSLQIPDHASLPLSVQNTTHDQETLTGQIVTVDAGTDARPATSPPVRYDVWTEKVQRPTVNVATNTWHIPIVRTTDVHTWTAPVPRTGEHLDRILPPLLLI